MEKGSVAMSFVESGHPLDWLLFLMEQTDSLEPFRPPTSSAADASEASEAYPWQLAAARAADAAALAMVD